MNKLALSLATLRYDHVADLITGHVTAEGITLNHLELSYHEILLRGVLFNDFDVAEISMAKYASMRSNGDDSLIAIPVFPNRMVRHTCSTADSSKRRPIWPVAASGCPSGRKPRRCTHAGYSRTTITSICDRSIGCKPVQMKRGEPKK